MSEIDFKELGQILYDLMKTIKVISVYPDNNPIPMKLKESFIYRFTDLIREYGGLKLAVDRNQLLINSKVVFEDRSDEEALALIFHYSGITEIQFTAQFETAQANQFFKAIKSYINREDGCEDLVALFWEADIGGFEYQTLDDIHLQNYAGDDHTRETAYYNSDDEADGNEADNVAYNAIFLDEEISSGESNKQFEQDKLDDGRMGFNKTEHRPENLTLPNMANLLNNAYKIGDDERKVIERLIKENENLDPFRVTSELIREMLYQENEYNEFIESVTVAEKIRTEFVRCGQIRYAGEILSHLQETKFLKSDRSSKWQEAIDSALIMAGGWESIAQLGRSLNDYEEITAEDLTAYLNHFDWHVLSALIDLLGNLENKSHRLALCDYLAENGKKNIDIIAKGIFDKRWFVVRNVVGILISIGGDKAFTYLAKAVDHEEPRVRINIAKCLAEYDNAKSIDIFMRLIWDRDSAVQKTAIAVIGKLAGETALNHLAQIIKDSRFEQLADSSKRAIILKFSEVGGSYAVQYLESLVNRFRGGLRSNRDYYRNVAFHALAINRSEKAEEVLKKMSKSWKKSVRQLAVEALRVRHQQIDEIAV
ncbi:MAG: HEAT repeat domain-containing protein [Candidatus Zixiibacteriota bacterium]